MKTNASIGVRALGAVFEVALHRTTDCCQLTTNLVMPTGLQVDFQQSIVLSLHKGLVGQNSEFCFFGTGLSDKRLVQLLVSREVVLQAPFRLFGTSLHNRPVRLFDLLVRLEHVIQTCERFARSGKEHYSTRRTVEPMRHAQEHLAGLVVFILDIGFHRLTQRRITRLIPLHDLIAGLIDSNNMIIFVKYGHLLFATVLN